MTTGGGAVVKGPAAITNRPSNILFRRTTGKTEKYPTDRNYARHKTTVGGYSRFSTNIYGAPSFSRARRATSTTMTPFSYDNKDRVLWRARAHSHTLATGQRTTRATGSSTRSHSHERNNINPGSLSNAREHTHSNHKHNKQLLLPQTVVNADNETHIVRGEIAVGTTTTSYATGTHARTNGGHARTRTTVVRPDDATGALMCVLCTGNDGDRTKRCVLQQEVVDDVDYIYCSRQERYCTLRAPRRNQWSGEGKTVHSTNYITNYYYNYYHSARKTSTICFLLRGRHTHTLSLSLTYIYGNIQRLTLLKYQVKQIRFV